MLPKGKSKPIEVKTEYKPGKYYYRLVLIEGIEKPLDLEDGNWIKTDSDMLEVIIDKE